MPVSMPPDPPALRCELTQQVENGTISITGLVYASEARAGTYQLRIVKSGPAGTSMLNQGGAFTIRPPEAAQVGRMAFSVEVGGAYTAQLRVTSGESSAECEGAHERL